MRSFLPLPITRTSFEPRSIASRSRSYNSESRKPLPYRSSRMTRSRAAASVFCSARFSASVNTSDASPRVRCPGSVFAVLGARTAPAGLLAMRSSPCKNLKKDRVAESFRPTVRLLSPLRPSQPMKPRRARRSTSLSVQRQSPWPRYSVKNSVSWRRSSS